jgi:hypothetical protein
MRNPFAETAAMVAAARAAFVAQRAEQMRGLPDGGLQLHKASDAKRARRALVRLVGRRQAIKSSKRLRRAQLNRALPHLDPSDAG